MPHAARRIRRFGLIALLHLGLSAAAFAAPVNVALNQAASASSQWADACAAAKANDGSDNASESCGGWSPDGTDAQSWWQVDLGQAYAITTLELVTRQNCCDDPETRQNFEIRASNDPGFASYVVLGAQGSTPLPFQATWTQNVSDPNGYRYIRATKPGYFFIAELRAWSEPATIPAPSGNLALNRPASASSVYADSCAAAKANDGSDNATENCGGWSPDGTDAQSWWQVDLGSPKPITTLELVTRQNCCDDPETRQNFEVRASNDPSFASSVVLGAQGSTPLPFQATWTQSVSDANSYRYIRATKAGYFFIAELKVFSASTGNQTPTVSLTNPANNASFSAPATITLSANASDADGSISKVEFYNGASLIGSDTDGADGWNINWSVVPAGTYTLSATAFDNGGASSASALANVTVNAAASATNLALNRPASASSVYADICAAAQANDGSDNASDSCGGWSPTGADVQSWWQVDLGQAYAITTLELVTRQNCCDDPETRQNFEVRASNDPSFASSVVLGAQGSTPLPFQATWSQSVSDPTGYRFIRATKPGYFFIAELKVFGNTPTNKPASNLYYIYPDHLNTARVITDTSNTILWRNDQADPFAASLPDEDPDGNGARFEFNLRFPGQYFDKETGLHYNYHRTYNPGTGAYTTVDPLGLAGGSFSTYSYANQNPLSFVDPLGLRTCILVTRNLLGLGTHSALYMSQGSDTGGPVLYDPSGNYSRDQRGNPSEGDLAYGDRADPSKFAKFHREKDGNTTKALCQDTPKAEEQRLYERALAEGAQSGFACATAVSNVIGGSSYFPGVSPGTFFPGNLFNSPKR